MNVQRIVRNEQTFLQVCHCARACDNQDRISQKHKKNNNLWNATVMKSKFS